MLGMHPWNLRRLEWCVVGDVAEYRLFADLVCSACVSLAERVVVQSGTRNKGGCEERRTRNGGVDGENAGGDHEDGIGAGLVE